MTVNLQLPASWKTTVVGLLSTGSGLVLYLQQQHYANVPGWLLGIATFISIGGAAALGLVAKDSNVTGGNVGQASTPEALHAANQEPSKENAPITKP